MQRAILIVIYKCLLSIIEEEGCMHTSAKRMKFLDSEEADIFPVR